MKIKHSRRYQEISRSIPKERLPIEKALSFLSENFKEKIKKLKLSFSLCWNNAQKKVLKGYLKLPYSASLGRTIIVVKDNLPNDLFKDLANEDFVKILTVDEIKNYFSDDSIDSIGGFDNKCKKRAKKTFRILAHPDDESNLKVLASFTFLKPLLPNKKNGFLTEKIMDEVRKIRLDEQLIKTDKSGTISVLLGTDKLTSSQLISNYQALYFAVIKMRPQNWKSNFLKSVVLSTAMGPGIKLAN